MAGETVEACLEIAMGYGANILRRMHESGAGSKGCMVGHIASWVQKRNWGDIQDIQDIPNSALGCPIPRCFHSGCNPFW